MSRPLRLILWFGPILVLGASCLWWFARGPDEAAARDQERAKSEVERRGHPREREVLELTRDKSADAKQRLIDLYADLAGDPASVGVRTLALRGLFSEPSVALRLKRVLDAVAADPTPAPRDPVWPELTKRLAEQWTPELFDKGRDLMLMEQRGRARRALVASFVDLAKSNQIASEEHRNALLTDLIDVHALVEPDQRPEVQDAVRVLGGNDPADLLAGRGLTGGDKLELQAEYERNLETAMKTLLPNAGPKAQ